MKKFRLPERAGGREGARTGAMRRNAAQILTVIEFEVTVSVTLA